MEDQKEIWKEIKDTDGKYSVSNYGNIRNNFKGIPVAQVLTGKPQYYYVNLHSNGRRGLVRVHRLVAETFLEKPEGLDVVDHIDRDKFNNKVSNLRWTDHKGNMSNRESSIFFGEITLVDYCSRYESPSAAYAYIHDRYYNKGATIEEAIGKYEEFLVYRYQTEKVDWYGEVVYLKDLCDSFGKDYSSVYNSYKEGKDLHMELLGLGKEYPYSFEVKSKTGVIMWIPSKNYAREFLGITDAALQDCVYYEDMLEFDYNDRFRQTVMGFTGTIGEVCKHFGISESLVNTRMTRRGMTLEEAIKLPRERVRYFSINGIREPTKDWWLHFNLKPRSVNDWRSENNKTIQEALEHFGVDTKDLVIDY